MQEEMLQMSKKELERSQVIRMAVEGQIKQKNAAKRLGLRSTRQVRRLVREYRRHGGQGKRLAYLLMIRQKFGRLQKLG